MINKTHLVMGEGMRGFSKIVIMEVKDTDKTKGSVNAVK